MTLREGGGSVIIIAATVESLDAEEAGGAAAAAVLGVAEPANWPPEHNDAQTRAWMRKTIRDGRHEPGYGSWYIIGDGRLVGTAGYKGPPDAEGEVEIGYAVVEVDQRKGFASGAIGLLVARAFRDPRVSVVTAETLVDGAASQGVLRYCGFELVGSGGDDEEGEVLRFVLARP